MRVSGSRPSNISESFPAMSSFGFYKRIVPLNANEHRNLKLATGDADFRFAAGSIAVLIACAEFVEAAREYPVIFVRGAGGKPLPAVLLGAREGENLFVDRKGKWLGRYVPAFVRRYPFVLAEGGPEGRLTVCIDESHPGLNVDDGVPLIGPKGETEPRLAEILAFLEGFQAEFQRTEAFGARLEALGLLKELGAQLRTLSGEPFTLTGFLGVDEQKLAKLPDDNILELHRTGASGLIALHLASLGNLSRLLDLLAERSAVTKKTRTSQPA